jgi:predicted AlkP superfamily pyrophosphatase or phosphodiesterase
MKLLYCLLFLFTLAVSIHAQDKSQPKLVVGVVVDQMRYDYLEKYYEDFDEQGGFKKLLREGTNFTNCVINYIPTVTAAGHASIYTGTTPFFNGIIANDWKHRQTAKNINACDAISPADKMFVTGISNAKSPEQLMCTTLGDQIKLANYGKSKVIGISIKDRGAMLTVGKSANGAFWLDTQSGKFISSFYYYKELPIWIQKFNNSGKFEEYLQKDWNLLRSEEVYFDLPSDNSLYEEDVFNEGRTSFPHTFQNVRREDLYEKLTHTPFGNQIILDFVKDALINEDLGKDQFIDHLAISFSTPDKVGHDYGPQSYEVKDIYLRLDLQLADLLNTLDAHVGNDNYILFLTADHGVMENTQHLIDMNFNAGVLENTNFYDNLISFLNKKYDSDKIIRTRFSRNLYLDYDELDKLNLNRTEVENSIKEYLLLNVDEIADVYTRTELESRTASRESNNYILNGFNKKRSGDILFSLKANYLNWEKKLGSQHGSRHEYDNHIPFILYGNNIPAEIRNERVYIVDIAATISDFIGVNKPSNCIGIPLLKRK